MSGEQRPFIVVISRGLLGGTEGVDVEYRAGFLSASDAVAAAQCAVRRCCYPEFAGPSEHVEFYIRHGLASGPSLSLPRLYTVAIDRPPWAYLAEALGEDWSDYGEAELLAAWNERFAITTVSLPASSEPSA